MSPKTKSQKKQSSPEFNKILKGSIKNKKLLQEGRQELSTPMLEDNTLIEKEQDSWSSSTLSRSFANRNRGKSLHLSNRTTSPTPTHRHHHLYRECKSRTPNIPHHQSMKSINILRHNMAPRIQKAHWQTTYN
jgi:hypothetical protein